MSSSTMSIAPAARAARAWVRLPAVASCAPHSTGLADRARIARTNCWLSSSSSTSKTRKPVMGHLQITQSSHHLTQGILPVVSAPGRNRRAAAPGVRYAAAGPAAMNAAFSRSSALTAPEARPARAGPAGLLRFGRLRRAYRCFCRLVGDLTVLAEIKAGFLVSGTHPQPDGAVGDPQDDPGHDERVGDPDDGQHRLPAELGP